MVLVNACGEGRPATLAWDMDHSALENSESPLILTTIIPTTIVEPALGFFSYLLCYIQLWYWDIYARHLASASLRRNTRHPTSPLTPQSTRRDDYRILVYFALYWRQLLAQDTNAFSKDRPLLEVVVEIGINQRGCARSA